MQARRKSRELALLGLFEHDFRLSDSPDTLENHINLEALNSLQFSETDTDGEIKSEAIPYASELLNGVITEFEALNDTINGASNNWKVSRMSLVDRNILRIATYELKFRSEEIPPKVVINEALEIAKKFSTQDSSAFINGILDQITKSIK